MYEQNCIDPRWVAARCLGVCEQEEVQVHVLQRQLVVLRYAGDQRNEWLVVQACQHMQAARFLEGHESCPQSQVVVPAVVVVHVDRQGVGAHLRRSLVLTSALVLRQHSAVRVALVWPLGPMVRQPLDRCP